MMLAPLSKPLLLASLFVLWGGMPSLAGNPGFVELPEHVRTTLEQATRSAGKDLQRQAEALIGLAWGEGDIDPEVRANARLRIVDYGEHATRALRFALPDVAPRYQADLVAALGDAGMYVPTGAPPDFAPGLESAIWLGSAEAKRQAMLVMGRLPAYPPAVLSIIDGITNEPLITTLGIRTLGRVGDARARFFLATVVRLGPEPWRTEAARALPKLGRTGLLMLRTLAASDEREAREPALAALLPHATVDDLSLLLEYYGFRTEDDPDLRERTRERAMELEIEFEKQQVEPPGDEPSEEPG